MKIMKSFFHGLKGFESCNRPEYEHDDSDGVVGDGEAEEGQGRAVRSEQRPEERPRRHDEREPLHVLGSLDSFFAFSSKELIINKLF